MTDNKKEKPADAGKTYTDVKVEKLPGSEIEITGEIPVDVYEPYRKKAINKISKNLELPGFRKGHVPDDMAIKQIGETELMKEIAEQALGKSYADIVEDKKLEVVGRPMITITKLAPKNPIGFKIKSAVFPTIELPDYKKIAKEERKKFSKDEISIKDEDIEVELKRLQKMMTGPEDGDEKETKETPNIDDEFAKSLGDFKNLEDLKGKMKEQMKIERVQKEKEKQRLTLADAVINKSKIEVPNLFIEGEIDQMVASFNDRVARAGLEMDAYLKQANKSMEDLRKEWRADAEKRAKLQLIFNEIAKEENLKPSPEKLAREVEHIKEHYPEANKESVMVYVSAQMINEKVFELLEGKSASDESSEDKESKEEQEDHVHDENCDHSH